MKGKNILLVTMSLGIGGAETHIVELSKKLVGNGHRVTVVSNGGVFVPVIGKNGVRHIKAPLHRKNPICLIKSYGRLKKAIIRGNIDIVHAHARIPAFVCNILCKRLSVPFVTTVHFEFKTSLPLKIFTRWGSRSLAVSEDIRSYLLENYSFDEDRTMLTVNGINEEIFHPRQPDEKTLREFDINPDDFVITTICRLDKGSSKTAAMLLEAAGTLNERIKGLRIIIAGDGSLYGRYESKAAAINKKLGRELVTMAGARKDVDSVLSATDIFTGISRAALEAMSMRKPVVLCGDFGYLGIIDEKNVKEAIRTNMTCRGSEEATVDMLVEDILKLHGSRNLREACADLNHSIVREHYSVSKMAKDAEDTYEKAFEEAKRPPAYYNAVVSGYYGFDNSGDEAMLASIIKELRKAKGDIRLLVLSKKPKKTWARHNVDSVARANPISIIRAFSKTGMLISGGGNLVQDLTSFQSMLYYTGLIRYAKSRGLKVMLYANGIGPLIRKVSEKIAALVLSDVDVITVREANSFEILKKIGVEGPVTEVTADPVMGVDKPDESTVKQALAKHLLSVEGKMAVFSVRPWKGLEGNFTDVFAKTADYVCDRYGMTPVFIPMNIKKDTKVLEEISNRMKNRTVIIREEENVENLISIISCSEIVVGMRLHSLIYAAVASTPAIGIVYDPKVRFFIDMMEQVDGGDIESLKADVLCGMIDHVIHNAATYSGKSAEKISMLRDLSIRNARMAIELMESGPEADHE